VEEEVEAMLGIREDEAWEGSVIVSKMVIYKDYLENGGGSVRRRQYALGKADGRWNIGEQSRGRQNDPQDLPRAPSAMSSEPAQRLTSFDVTMSSSPDARRQKNMGNPDHPGTNFGKLTKELSARFLLDPGWSHEAEGSGRADGRLQLVSLSRDMGVNPSPLAVRGERGHGTEGSFAAGPSFRRDRFKPRLNLSSHSLGSSLDCRLLKSPPHGHLTRQVLPTIPPDSEESLLSIADMGISPQRRNVAMVGHADKKPDHSSQTNSSGHAAHLPVCIGLMFG